MKNSLLNFLHVHRCRCRFNSVAGLATGKHCLSLSPLSSWSMHTYFDPPTSPRGSTSLTHLQRTRSYTSAPSPACKRHTQTHTHTHFGTNPTTSRHDFRGIHPRARAEADVLQERTNERTHGRMNGEVVRSVPPLLFANERTRDSPTSLPCILAVARLFPVSIL